MKLECFLHTIDSPFLDFFRSISLRLGLFHVLRSTILSLSIEALIKENFGEIKVTAIKQGNALKPPLISGTFHITKVVAAIYAENLVNPTRCLHIRGRPWKDKQRALKEDPKPQAIGKCMACSGENHGKLHVHQ